MKNMPIYASNKTSGACYALHANWLRLKSLVCACIRSLNCNSTSRLPTTLNIRQLFSLFALPTMNNFELQSGAAEALASAQRATPERSARGMAICDGKNAPRMAAKSALFAAFAFDQNPLIDCCQRQTRVFNAIACDFCIEARHCRENAGECANQMKRSSSASAAYL